MQLWTSAVRQHPTCAKLFMVMMQLWTSAVCQHLTCAKLKMAWLGTTAVHLLTAQAQVAVHLLTAQTQVAVHLQTAQAQVAYMDQIHDVLICWNISVLGCTIWTFVWPSKSRLGHTQAPHSDTKFPWSSYCTESRWSHRVCLVRVL